MLKVPQAPLEHRTVASTSLSFHLFTFHIAVFPSASALNASTVLARGPMSASSLPTPGELSPTHAGASNKRYDRQVRLWGAHGQELLQSARICMLGAGPVATETLKNLVLGGIASFTIVDHKEVSERDLGNNFFFDQDALGSGRAEAAARLLRELNDSVKGSFSESNIHDLLQQPDNFFQEFSLVIASEVPSLRVAL